MFIGCYDFLGVCLCVFIWLLTFPIQMSQLGSVDVVRVFFHLFYHLPGENGASDSELSLCGSFKLTFCFSDESRYGIHITSR